MIKKLFFAAMLIMSSITIAQAQQLNYQGIARNANGVAISFQEVSIRLTIHDLIAAGPTLFPETRLVKTNQFGLINIVIGSPGATNTFGSLSGINWAGGSKFLQVEIDPLGGNSFQQAGTSQLQSVPYAFFASAAYPVGPAGGDLLGSTYPNPIIAPFTVTTTKLGDTAVTTRKIADSAVNTSKILNRAVTTEKIMDSAVTTAKLRNKGVTNEKLADSVITTDKIKNGAITNEKIADGTIQNIKLVNSTITLNGLVLNLGGSQSFVVDSAGTDVNIASANSIHRFNFPNASIANRGLITANTQTIGGNKIFNNNITAASFIKSGGIAAQFLKADGTVDNNIYLTANQPIIITATGDATGVSTSSGTAPVLPLTLATVNSTAGVFGTNIVIPSITVNTKGLITNVIANPIPTATSTTLGLLTSANWNTFNNKQNFIPLGTIAQYFRGDLSLSNFETDVRAQLSAGTNITYANGQFGILNNGVTINTLPLTLGGSQTFATGTGGVDFNISSLGTVHTFNIPSASTFARGLLTSTDYTNFNTAYNNRITSLTTTGPNGPATLGSNILNIPTYTLPAAAGTTLGGTIIGANISNSGGTISLSSSNITNALGTQSPNLILASPNGISGTPIFRTLVGADIPDNTITNAKLINNATIIGTTSISLGASSATLAGLTSVTSTGFTGALTGNASSATILQNSRTIGMTGDVTYTSGSFNGSANVSGTSTLANSGVTAASYGSATSTPTFTVDAKGRITNATSTTITGVSNIGSALTSGNIIVGSAANLAASVAMSGDVSISNTGVTTIATNAITTLKVINNAITLLKIEAIPDGTFLANVSGAAASPIAYPIPSGILNQTTLQAGANFNISGRGIAGKFVGNSGLPTITGATLAAGGAGVATAIDGNDAAGVISFTVGAGPTVAAAGGSTLFELSFNSAYTSPPVVLINVVKKSGLGLGGFNDIFVIPSSTVNGKFILTLRETITLTATDAFQIAYHVLGR